MPPGDLLEEVSTHSRPKAAGRACRPLSLRSTIVSTHSRPKAAGHNRPAQAPHHPVSTHSRPKAAGRFCPQSAWGFGFQLTAARRRLAADKTQNQHKRPVSTHSRPKAAGFMQRRSIVVFMRFNSQPPEGGWSERLGYRPYTGCFNSQPPEGGWFC